MPNSPKVITVNGVAAVGIAFNSIVYVNLFFLLL